MKKIYELKEMLCDELDKLTGDISKNKLSAQNLEFVYKLTDTIKNIDKICMLEEDDGYSGDGNWRAMIDGDYGHRMSHARRGGRGGNRSSYRRGYSKDEAMDEMMDKLEDMMYDADDATLKEAIKRCMDSIKKM